MTDSEAQKYPSRRQLREQTSQGSERTSEFIQQEAAEQPPEAQVSASETITGTPAMIEVEPDIESSIAEAPDTDTVNDDMFNELMGGSSSESNEEETLKQENFIEESTSNINDSEEFDFSVFDDQISENFPQSNEESQSDYSTQRLLSTQESTPLPKEKTASELLEAEMLAELGVYDDATEAYTPPSFNDYEEDERAHEEEHEEDVEEEKPKREIIVGKITSFSLEDDEDEASGFLKGLSGRFQKKAKNAKTSPKVSARKAKAARKADTPTFKTTAAISKDDIKRNEKAKPAKRRRGKKETTPIEPVVMNIEEPILHAAPEPEIFENSELVNQILGVAPELEIIEEIKEAANLDESKSDVLHEPLIAQGVDSSPIPELKNAIADPLDDFIAQISKDDLTEHESFINDEPEIIHESLANDDMPILKNASDGIFIEAESQLETITEDSVIEAKPFKEELADNMEESQEKITEIDERRESLLPEANESPSPTTSKPKLTNDMLDDFFTEKDTLIEPKSSIFKHKPKEQSEDYVNGFFDDETPILDKNEKQTSPESKIKPVVSALNEEETTRIETAKEQVIPLVTPVIPLVEKRETPEGTSVQVVNPLSRRAARKIAEEKSAFSLPSKADELESAKRAHEAAEKLAKAKKLENERLAEEKAETEKKERSITRRLKSNKEMQLKGPKEERVKIEQPKIKKHNQSVSMKPQKAPKLETVTINGNVESAKVGKPDFQWSDYGKWVTKAIANFAIASIISIAAVASIVFTIIPSLMHQFTAASNMGWDIDLSSKLYIDKWDGGLPLLFGPAWVSVSFTILIIVAIYCFIYVIARAFIRKGQKQLDNYREIRRASLGRISQEARNAYANENIPTAWSDSTGEADPYKHLKEAEEQRNFEERMANNPVGKGQVSYNELNSILEEAEAQNRARANEPSLRKIVENAPQRNVRKGLGGIREAMLALNEEDESKNE